MWNFILHYVRYAYGRKKKYGLNNIFSLIFQSIFIRKRKTFLIIARKTDVFYYFHHRKICTFNLNCVISLHYSYTMHTARYSRSIQLHTCGLRTHLHISAAYSCTHSQVLYNLILINTFLGQVKCCFDRNKQYLHLDFL